MTNKPMLSVERELLERVTSQTLGMSAKKDRAYAAHELRAILEKTECIKCKDTGEVDSGGVQPWGEGINITCDCVLAAKQQSAPMAWVIQWGSVIPGCRGHREVVLKDPGDLDAVITPLYTEQPAPLKIGAAVIIENVGFKGEKGRSPYLVFDGDGCLTQVNLIDLSLVSKRQAHTIRELEALGVRVEQPAPVAVVMPFAEEVIAKLQRFEACVGDGQDVDISREWFDTLTHLGLLIRCQRSPAYWEITKQGADALEVARLNGVKP